MIRGMYTSELEDDYYIKLEDTDGSVNVIVVKNEGRWIAALLEILKDGSGIRRCTGAYDAGIDVDSEGRVKIVDDEDYEY
ncbi:MAG: hypothetical protein M0R51_17640 [Clostridia bacterium]|jgi:hypothetical protein|nr:hypothetical protein [Clostridia bacterium]